MPTARNALTVGTLLAAAGLILAGETTRIEVGKPAPDFALKDQDGKELKLSDLKGKNDALLVFLPRDPVGSTAALAAFREEHAALQKRDILLLGISTDVAASHAKLRKELRLPYALLSDEGGKTGSAYGVPGAGTSGSVFLVDRGSVVRFADLRYELDPAADRAALHKAIAALKPAGGDAKNAGAAPRITGLKFGEITVDGKRYDTDVVIAHGKVRERDKTPSRDKKAKYDGHTPLTLEEKIPWDCKVLLIGIGMDGRLPVEEALKKEAQKRGIKLIILETPKAVEHLEKSYDEDMNVILHVTC